MRVASRKEPSRWTWRSVLGRRRIRSRCMPSIMLRGPDFRKAANPSTPKAASIALKAGQLPVGVSEITERAGSRVPRPRASTLVDRRGTTMTRQTRTVFLAGALAVFTTVGCGKSPLAPTDPLDLAVPGPSIAVVPSAGVAAAGREEGRVHLSSVTSDPVTITVLQVPSISTTVNLGETAILTGLPPGSYTLVFTQNGTVIG